MDYFRSSAGIRWNHVIFVMIHCTDKITDTYVFVTVISFFLFVQESVSIRIYHECEGMTEKSVPRIAIWHHEACRVMTKGDPEGRIFVSYSHTNNGLFFLLTTVFYLKISFQKSLNTLRYNFT